MAGLKLFDPDMGWALIHFSMVLNLALLPVYRAMEEAGRAGASDRAAMEAEVARMKAHYKGRERYFYIKAVHRIFHHRPIAVVFRSGELYLQVLVFATVYRFLASNESLRGAPFYAIPDLAQPDGLLWGQNLLPLLMTVLNVLSALFYDKSRAKRRNAFVMAGIFLVLLYASPAGLVLYWTCNNAFSLVRNMVQPRIRERLPGLMRVWSRIRAQV